MTKQEFETKIKIVGNHWIWKYSTTFKGYGRLTYKGKRIMAHRYAMYLYCNFDLNDSNKSVLHKNECHNRRCCNPEHLYIGDAWDNMQDAIKLGTYKLDNGNSKKTHCPQGHEYSKENTRIKRGSRHCRECGRIEVRARRLREKELLNHVSE
jgi:hypothetical protein